MAVCCEVTSPGDDGRRTTERKHARLWPSLVLLLGMMALALSAVAFPNAALAAVPPVVTHQGRLLDVNDVPVTGSLPVTFAIYDSSSGGASIWTETHSVTFDGGYYSVALGTQSPLDAALLG